MIKITDQQIQKLASTVHAPYREAFKDADAILAPYSLNQNPLRVAHFMAQVLHETGGLTISVESMSYTARRLMEVWPERFPSLASAEPFVRQPRALANHVYNGRMGNRPGTDDGWSYIGHGLLQLTGREDYLKYGTLLSIDLAGSPELAFDPRYALRIAAAEWNAKECNPLADQDNLLKITKRINGGTVGLAERREWLAKTKQVWK